MKLSHSSRAGAALMLALACAAVLFSMGAATFFVVQSKYRVVHQAASWDEALLSAEAGVEMAMNEIRKDLYDSSSAWSGWARSEQPIGGSSPGTAGGSSYYFTSQALLRKGEGGQRSFAQVTVDAPLCLKDRTGEQWFRIRATGTADVPGGRIAAGEKQDIKLRKLSLARDRKSGAALATPQATRVIEAIAKPVGAFRLALFGTSTIDLTDHNIVVDSYDSRDSTKSTNGNYDPAKRQEHGDIATNGQVLHAGDAHIYGDASTNGGTVFEDENVTGEIRNDFYQEVFIVRRPNVLPDPGTPTYVHDDAVFQATPSVPSQYQLSSLQLSGSSTLQIKGAEDGSPTYCQIVVTGDVSLSGQASIQIDPGVYVRIFVEGNADIGGNGFLNPNSPLHLQLYGCDRPPNADGTPAAPGMMKISGNGGFSGAVYAPNYDIEMEGGGNSDTLFGAFVGKSVRMTGVQAVHYDEALGEGGLISDYKIVSWFEDER